MKFLYVVVLLIVSSFYSFAQSGKDSLIPDIDSIQNDLPEQDTIRNLPVKNSSSVNVIRPNKQDSLIKSAIPPAVKDSYQALLSRHPYLNFSGNPRNESAFKAAARNKDGLFYLLAGLVLYFALVRLLFRKYMSNLFAVFFGVSLKQKQIREQLLQNTLPSMLLNIFFVIAGGIYISFLFDHYDFSIASNKWYVILYCTLALATIYLVKFLVLKLMGWMLNISGATDTYIFVVFLVSKMLGLFLIPFLVLLAFSSPSSVHVFIILSFLMVAIFFAYRYLVAYSPVRKEIKVSQFHFFLYLCAFEIIPLLLIYKVLFTYLERST